MTKTKNIWLFIATVMLAVCVLGFTFSVTTPEVNAETGETWTASGNWDTTTEGEYKLAANSSLSQLTYNGEMGKVTSIKFDFTYTTNTIAGDHWFGVNINGWWHQLFLNASHETALPYMAIYAPGAGSPTYTRIDSRIPRENIPLNTKNTFDFKLDESNAYLYINDELIYTFSGYTHSNVTSLIIGSRDVETTISNPVVTAEAKQQPTSTWTASGNWNTETENEYKLEANSSLSKLTYNGVMGKVLSVKFDFSYTNSTIAGDHWFGLCVNGWWHQLFLNASHATALPYMAIYQPGAGSPTFTRIDSRIPRENIPLNTKNTCEFKLGGANTYFYINDQLIYSFTEYTHSSVNELIIGSRDVEITIGNPIVTLKADAPADKTQLNALIEKVGAVEESKYTSETYEALTAALEKANALSENAIQEEVDAAYAALNAAYGALKEKPGDKTQLNELIATVEALEESKYTTETYAALKTALDKAKALTENATQEEVDAAYAELNTAYGALQLKPGDKTQLNALIATVEALEENKYTAETYAAVKTALDKAKALAENATQEEVDAAYAELNTAYGALQLKPGDKTQLNALIATVEALEENKYTAETYAAVKTALDKAKALAENATQEQVDAAYTELDAAYKALEEKPTDPDTDSSTDSGSISDSGSQSEEEKTGCFGGIETTSVMLFMLGMVAVYTIIKRRKTNN